MYTAQTFVDMVLREMENEREAARKRTQLYRFDPDSQQVEVSEHRPILSYVKALQERIASYFAPSCPSEATCQ